ncbi:glycoside hydrolase family 97 protein [Botryobacter ruber]|uniref:glycoside hydrolase family 97 protein n=1 Tax=Botryobacter ruber TaxID=2171629 RepID=UPI0013E308A7|nr:glycoside hydrolase family 97 protein [Botryobacter ruber]
MIATTTAVTAQDENTVMITSPDGAVTMTVASADGGLTYAVTYKKTPVVTSSRLGLVVDDQVFGEDATVGKAEKYSANEKYLTRGAHQVALNKYKGARIPVASEKAPFVLDVRVFNDGVAFRYLIESKDKAVVEKELTRFDFPAGSIVWSQPESNGSESPYSRKKLEAFKANEQISLPATIVLPGKAAYAAVTEAGLVNFAGMSLVADGKQGFAAQLAGDTRRTGKLSTPWRVVLVGKDLNTLVNSDVVTSLSPAFSWKLFPNAYNTRWVDPGRCVWSGLAGRGPVTLENMKYFTDKAAALGYEYNLVDEGWGHWKEGKRDHWDLMKELVEYAAKKGVKIWVWKAYPDRRGIIGLEKEGERKAFFKKCKELGIAGVKIEYFDVDPDAQDIVQFCQTALQDAAAQQLMVSFRGAGKPTGEIRTWPNEMSREVVRGQELNPPWAPANVTLPFTRLLAGHTGYVPVQFGKQRGEVTWAHHIASMAVLSAPVVFVAADPQSIIQNPAVRMMQRIPTTWDETIVLPQSEIGELVVYARRKGTTWFLAAMNGQDEAKTVKVDLAFLKRGNYTLHEVSDTSGKQDSVALNSRRMSRWSSLKLSLNPYGGYIGRFEKIIPKTAPKPEPAPEQVPAPSARPALPPTIPAVPKKTAPEK